MGLDIILHLLWVWISFFTFCGFGYHSSPFVGLDIILHLLWVWLSFFTFCGFGYHSSPCVGLVIILHLLWVWISFFTFCGFGYHSSPFSSHAQIVGLVPRAKSAVLVNDAPIPTASKISCSSTSSDQVTHLTVRNKIDDISQNCFFVCISV